ncbi:MAG: hypothetical protein V5A29_16170 [Haloarculaceae archaeon]
MTSRLWSTLVVAFLFVGLVGGTAAGTASGVEPDRVVMDVAVEADGDARWRVAYRFRLSDENASAAFEELKASVEQNASAYRERLAARMERTVRAAENETGREMAVTDANVDLSTSDGGSTGVVKLSVTYERLAAVEDGRLTVTEPFASGFETDYRFTLRGPDGYRLTSVAPEPASRDDGRATWSAGSNLSGFEATLTSESGTTATVSDGSDGAVTGETTGDASSRDGAGFGLLVAILAIVAMGLGRVQT